MGIIRSTLGTIFGAAGIALFGSLAVAPQETKALIKDTIKALSESEPDPVILTSERVCSVRYTPHGTASVDVYGVTDKKDRQMVGASGLLRRADGDQKLLKVGDTGTFEAANTSYAVINGEMAQGDGGTVTLVVKDWGKAASGLPHAIGTCTISTRHGETVGSLETSPLSLGPSANL